MTRLELKSGLEKVNYYAFLLLAFSLNFPQTVVRYSLAIWLISCLFSIDYKEKPNFKRTYYLPLYLISVLILGRIIVSLIHNDFSALLAKLLDTQLSLIFLPILLIFHVNRHFNLKQILLVYVVGCFTSCFLVVCYFYLYRFNLLIGDVEGIPLGTNKHNLIEDIKIFQLFISPYFKHRAAVGTNISLSFAALIYLIKTEQKFSLKNVCLAILSFAIFALVIYVSGSRSGIMSFIFVLLAGAVYTFRKKKIIFISFLIVGLLIACLSTLKTTRLIDKGVKYENDISTIDPRIQIWKSSVEIINGHPWLGVGYSGVKPALFKKYEEKGLKLDLQAKHNTHNQFLQFAMESGVWAAVIFALILLPIYFRRKIYFLSFAFSSVFIVYSMFEDTFIIINALSIFVFFISLLILAQKQNDEILSE
ncbi:O-antigen polymerase [Paludibacter propionicigenes WB4]|uniref:O-antigen polymerase n=1 Tax=Paludibacter propionicigenes (strain DSM 17365 / JCM 13257 / WB4) TaxID=694427 RepID=E4T5U3_PALPW|nr:O-antigen ligase family protein [Paludibacter propionicigenes]ADQ80087.1 O-antigen polymerase [Paludibacter propionicigenes WB4]